LLVAINQHEGPVSPRKSPRYGPDDNEIYLHKSENLSNIAYYWTGGDFARGAEINNTGFGSNEARNGRRVIIEGDDDFVVLFGMDRWVVWCFDRGVKVPASALDSHLPPSVLHPLSS
jgi:hypothetical protein